MIEALLKLPLDDLAAAARQETLKYFGHAIQLYAPLYISNECVNDCAYCGFNRKSRISRVTLNLEQILKEARFLRRQGFQHILLLSGEAPEKVPVDFLCEVVGRLKQLFHSVSIEIYPLDTGGYRDLAEAGADGLTLYQETYHRPTYRKVHPAGPKRDFDWRLKAVERAAQSGTRRIGLGVLLGLYDWRFEAAQLADHLRYLLKKYWRTQFQLSFPRLNPAETAFKIKYPVSNEELLRMICAFRLLFPQVGFTLSTRERAALRDRIFPFGITQMSAGSKTYPGAYALGLKSGKQFEIADSRSVKEVARSLTRAGYDPVFKDWDVTFK